MPHAALVAFTGFRVVDPELRALGLSLPGLKRRGEAIAALPALGLLTVAAHTPEHWSQSFHEAPAYSPELAESIARECPDIVAISALTASIEEGYALCVEMRKRGIATVIGGLHATSCPEEVLEHADAVVVGDGETAWPLVLSAFERGETSGVYHGGTFNLDESRLPRWDLLPAGKRRRYTVQTSRGCPLACEFCAASRLLGPFREKPPELIQAELQSVKALDPRAPIELADDNTFAGDRDPKPLLRTLRECGLPWFTECDIRIADDPALCRAMAEAGCAQVLVGIESPVHPYAGMGDKSKPIDEMRSAIERIQGEGLPVNACFVVGADGETKESIRALGELLESWPSADVQITLQTPFPATVLRHRLRNEGRLLKERTWRHHNLFEVTYQASHMTPDALMKGYRTLLSKVYSTRMTRRRMQIRKSLLRGRRRARA